MDAWKRVKDRYISFAYRFNLSAVKNICFFYSVQYIFLLDSFILNSSPINHTSFFEASVKIVSLDNIETFSSNRLNKFTWHL